LPLYSVRWQHSACVCVCVQHVLAYVSMQHGRHYRVGHLSVDL
jgi:hypothetical protein